MDRRTFLKRSGIGVGAGIAVSQLNLVQKATAADPSKAMLERLRNVRRSIVGTAALRPRDKLPIKFDTGTERVVVFTGFLRIRLI